MLAAAWVQAIAASIAALAIVYAVVLWAWNRRPRGAVQWIKDRYFPPRVSLESGIRAARKVARSGHAPSTPTNWAPSPELPLEYLLAKTVETVWAAASSGQSEPEPYLLPVRNYITALIGAAGLSPARDFALGVLTERVRQEEDGWPDQPGDPGGKRGAHGSGNTHTCLLGRKQEVEDAIYSAG